VKFLEFQRRPQTVSSASSVSPETFHSKPLTHLSPTSDGNPQANAPPTETHSSSSCSNRNHIRKPILTLTTSPLFNIRFRRPFKPHTLSSLSILHPTLILTPTNLYLHSTKANRNCKRNDSPERTI